MTSVAKALGIDLNSTLGAAFIGLVVSAVFYGITVVQTIGYFEHCSRDPKYLKIVVGILFLLDTLHMILMSHVMYTYLVTNFGNVLGIAATLWSIDTMVLVTVISCCIVDLCYLHRVWIISKNNIYLVAPMVLCILVVTGVGLGIGVKCFQYKSILQVEEVSWMMYFAFCGAIVNNVCITTSLCYYLSKSRTGFSASEKKLASLMKYIIGTGFLTVICSICVLATFATMPRNYIFLAFYESYSKIFFNALLAMLNARERLANSSSSSNFGSGNDYGANAKRLPNVIYVGSNKVPGSGAPGQLGFSRSDFIDSDDGRKGGTLTNDSNAEVDYPLHDVKADGHHGRFDNPPV